MLPSFKKMHVSARIGRQMQCINSLAKRDHYPIYAEFSTQSTVHMPDEKHRWDRDRAMKAVKGNFPIRKQFIEVIEEQFECEEYQKRVDVAELEPTPDEFWKRFHDEVIHKVAKEQFTFTQDKADEDFKPFIKFVKQDGGTLVTETRSLRRNEKSDHGNELQNLKKERREYMKQRQRLRMQGHDVNMCKNVINKYLEGFAFTTMDNNKDENMPEDITLAITMLQRRIKKLSIKMYEAREDLLTRELKQAQRQHDFSNVHRLSRRRSGKKISPKRIVFGRAHAKRLGVEEWETAMEKQDKKEDSKR